MLSGAIARDSCARNTRRARGLIVPISIHLSRLLVVRSPHDGLDDGIE